MFLQEELMERKNIRLMLQTIESVNDKNLLNFAEKVMEECGTTFDKFLAANKQQMTQNHMALLDSNTMTVVNNVQYEIYNELKKDAEVCRQKLDELFQIYTERDSLTSKKVPLLNFASIFQASVRQYAIEQEIDPGKYITKECAAAFHQLDIEELLESYNLLEEDIER